LQHFGFAGFFWNKKAKNQYGPPKQEPEISIYAKNLKQGLRTKDFEYDDDCDNQRRACGGQDADGKGSG
jgi:hypothetical protein